MTGIQGEAETTEIILTAHGIGNPYKYCIPRADPMMWISADQFESLLDHVTFGVALTFDDGFRSCWDIAFPALVKRNLTAKFFVTVGNVGLEGYLNKRQLLDLSAGGMQIGTHGMAHRPWRKLSQDGISEEIFEAKEKLEDIVGTGITEAACPFGAYDHAALSNLRKSGIERVYTSDRLPASPGSWLRPRYTVLASDTPQTLAKITSGRDPWVPWFRRTKMIIKQWR